MTAPDTIRKVFVIAGEHSGDALGASLMTALSEKLNGNVAFAGVGGPQMGEAGLDSLFPMEDLAVMGVFEVLPRLSKLLKRMRQTVKAVLEFNPDVVISIDSPDFCFRVIKKIKARGGVAPVVHYVAPSVWAWREGRAAKVAKFLDHLLCLLPFEPPYFHREGLDATFVGHPVVAGQLGDGDGAAFRARHAVAAHTPMLCVLPGSRSGEISRLLGVFGEAAQRLAAQVEGLCVVIPAVEHLKTVIDERVSDWPMRTVVVNAQEKGDAFAASDVALAASGTVTLELAMARLPHVIGYRLNAFTAFVARRLIKTPYVNLINICLKREAVPEFLLENCTADNLARELARLLGDTRAREAQIAAAREALIQLGHGGPPPGERAADVVLSVMGAVRKET